MPGNLKRLPENKCEGNMAQGGEPHNSLKTAQNKHHSLQGMTEQAEGKKKIIKKRQATLPQDLLPVH